MNGAGGWMRSSLSTHGYCLSDAERRELALGLPPEMFAWLGAPAYAHRSDRHLRRAFR
jgi:hypothetical protein